jgi:hypothetical protein
MYAVLICTTYDVYGKKVREAVTGRSAFACGLDVGVMVADNTFETSSAVLYYFCIKLITPETYIRPPQNARLRGPLVSGHRNTTY